MNYLKPKKQPLVSVLMPVYNAMPYLKEAIESVLSQTYRNFEFIIIDDASTDDSWQGIKKFAAKNQRIKAFRHRKNLGVGTTRNQLIKLAKGQYIAIMDADDLMAAERLKKQVVFLQKNRKVVAVGSWMKEINIDSKITGQRKLPTKHRQIYGMMYYLMGLQHPSIMINRELLPSNFEWYQKGAKKVVDLPVLFRLLKHGQFANIPQFLTYYRIHDKNLSTFRNSKAVFLRARKIRKKAVRYYGYVPTLKGKILHFIENIVISLIPEKYILSLYAYFRSK